MGASTTTDAISEYVFSRIFLEKHAPEPLAWHANAYCMCLAHAVEHHIRADNI